MMWSSLRNGSFRLPAKATAIRPSASASGRAGNVTNSPRLGETLGWNRRRNVRAQTAIQKMLSQGKGDVTTKGKPLRRNGPIAALSARAVVADAAHKIKRPIAAVRR